MKTENKNISIQVEERLVAICIHEVATPLSLLEDPHDSFMQPFAP